MIEEYQDRLDFLYGRLNYEWVGMPRIPSRATAGTDASASESARVIHTSGCA